MLSSPFFNRRAITIKFRMWVWVTVWMSMGMCVCVLCVTVSVSLCLSVRVNIWEYVSLFVWVTVNVCWTEFDRIYASYYFKMQLLRVVQCTTDELCIPRWSVLPMYNIFISIYQQANDLNNEWFDKSNRKKHTKPNRTKTKLTNGSTRQTTKQTNEQTNTN